MEQAIIAREGPLPFHAVRAAGVRGRSPIALLGSLATLTLGVGDALAVLRRTRPTAILGTGGYVCVPVFVAARLLGIPTLIYLPDIVPGWAVKVLSRLATGVACSFPPSVRFFNPRKTVVTGYPVRQELFTLRQHEGRQLFGLDDALPVVVIYGGSRGARPINRAIAAILPELTARAQVLHVCGREGDETWLQAAAAKLPVDQQARYHLHSYLAGTMGHALAAADLAIARAGASTLAELPAVGLPAVLVPLTAVHQDDNARYLVDAGAALMVDNDAMLGTGAPADGPLWQAVRSLLDDPVRLQAMRTHSRALAVPDAAERLADALLAFV